MFISCLGSITDHDNRLGFKSARGVCCILVDGLGASNLKDAAGHAIFLNQTLSKSASISCGFPSTTATSIVSFATGMTAAQHGYLGYRILDRSTSQDLNLLTGYNSQFRGEDFQPAQTVSERATELGVKAYFVGPPDYSGSGFTMATMRGASYVAARTIEERFKAALMLLNKNEHALVYLYVPELDQAAHGFGTSSSRWLNLLEELDSQVKKFVQLLPNQVGAILTADHGIVDVEARKHFFLDESGIDEFGVGLVAGDPRVPYIYLSQNTDEVVASAIELLQSWLGSNAWVLSGQELIQTFFAELEQKFLPRVPDVAIVCRTEIAIYHRAFAKSKSMQMIGQHGSISSKELSVPLLKFGALS